MKQVYFLLFFFIINFVSGQEREASILFYDNTTVEGFGEIKNNKIFFRLTQEEKPEIWTHEEAKGLWFKSHSFSEKYIYVNHGKNNEAKLMETVQEGPIMLYQDVYFVEQGMSFGNGTGTRNTVKITDFYIKKAVDNKAIKVTLDFKKIGLTFFADCEDLTEKINEETFFETEEIIDLVKYYNRNCSK